MQKKEHMINTRTQSKNNKNNNKNSHTFREGKIIVCLLNVQCKNVVKFWASRCQQSAMFTTSDHKALFDQHLMTLNGTALIIKSGRDVLTK